MYPHLKVQQIAGKCGYSDVSHFIAILSVAPAKDHIYGKSLVFHSVFIFSLAEDIIKKVERDQEKARQHESLGDHNAEEEEKHGEDEHGPSESAGIKPDGLCEPPILIPVIQTFP